MNLHGLTIALLMAVVIPQDAGANALFTEKVWPLLESRCVSCHGPDKVKGGLRLDSREAALKAGDSGQPAVVPQRPSDSLLLQAVMHARKELEMPPKEKLTARDIAVFEEWIRIGAPWPERVEAVAAVAAGTNAAPVGDAWSDPRNPIVRIFGGQRLDLWSLRPVAQVAPPEVKNRRWVRNPIDRFTLSRLERAGATVPVEANRRTLARRLYFDLTGLPPTPGQVERFQNDRRPDAFERLVEELLASPRHGEHWARLWLDVVRYSDSNGFDWDEFRPRAWRFRDYVIRSLNADKPFDRFIREQIAGDELFNGAPTNAAQQEALVATGYLRLGPQDNSAGAFNEQDRARAEWMADLTETTGSAFLGLTLSCARCHDHKFDPVSQADHFRLRAFFEPLQYSDDTPLDVVHEQAAIRAHNRSIDEALRPVTRRRDELLATTKAALRAELVARLTAEEKALLESTDGKTTNELKSRIEGIRKKVEPSDKETKAALKDLAKTTYDGLEKELAALRAKRREFTLGLLAADGTNKVKTTRILFQGDHKAEREPVEPGFLSALNPNAAKIRSTARERSTGRRSALAGWIASPENPLTARVLANRLWQGYFGVGLVATPNDFGLAGERPSDPALLDWLAGELVRSGWSMKHMHRLIVTSTTYRSRLGSVPGNEPVSPPRRLSAEQLRDSLLSVSGLLTSKADGPPIWPDLPAEIAQANPAFLDDNAEKTKGWYPSAKAEQHARSVFLVQKRTVRVPFLETFDLPENSVSCARRNESTVAPQALSLLNSPLAVEAAAAFAARVKHEAEPGSEAQVRRAFALALQRQPDREELRACVALAARRSLTEVCRALMNLNEFIYLD